MVNTFSAVVSFVNFFSIKAIDFIAILFLIKQALN